MTHLLVLDARKNQRKYAPPGGRDTQPLQNHKGCAYLEAIVRTLSPTPMPEGS